MSGETLLVLSGEGMPQYAVRGTRQSFEPIEAALKPRRTVNGVLVNTAPTKFRKYKSTVSCSDMQSPAFDAVYLGRVLTVDFIPEQVFKTAGGAADRPAVPGSLRVDGDYTFYRMRLDMMVMAKTIEIDDEGVPSWSLELEEI